MDIKCICAPKCMCAERYTGIINDFLFVLRLHGRLNSIECRHWFDEYRSLLHHTARADFDFSFHFVSFHLFASSFIVITHIHTYIHRVRLCIVFGWRDQIYLCDFAPGCVFDSSYCVSVLFTISIHWWK